MKRAQILIADDDPGIREMLQEIISALGHEVSTAATAAETLAATTGKAYDLVLLDLTFPDATGLATLSRIREQAPGTDVIIVTAESDNLKTVAEATRLGAFDYVPKPIREDDIRIRVTRVLELRALTRAHAYAVAELASGRELGDIIGSSAAIRTVVKEAARLAAYPVPVLITGETGTGKELVARALHYGGPLRDKPFVSINCAALPHELTESELFGHEKGAFTGAHVARPGAFEEAGDGTLFLDEIGDMPLQAQATLLHVLEQGEYRSVGGRVKKSAARVVLATNQDLNALLHENAFRKDLFYRVNRVRIVIPPLRQRPEDIPELALHFLRLFEEKVAKGVRAFAPEALGALQRYDWPGNVRELKNEIERAYIHTERETIALLDLSPEVVVAQAPGEEGAEVDAASLEELYKLVEALKACSGNVTRAAAMLKVHRNTVHRWIKKYSIAQG